MEILYLNKSKYYVYKHYIYNVDGTENVFYIGKGIGDRIYSQNRNLYWKNIVMKNEGKYNIEIIQYCDNEDDAYKLERKLQEYYWSIGQCRGCADIKIKNDEVKVKKHTKIKTVDLNLYNDIDEIIDTDHLDLAEVPVDNNLISNKRINYKLLFKLIACGIDLHNINKEDILSNIDYIGIKCNSIYKSFNKIRKEELIHYDYENYAFHLKYNKYISMDREIIKFMCDKLSNKEIKIFLFILLNNLNNRNKLTREELIEGIGLSKSGNNIKLITDITNKLHSYKLIFKDNNFNIANKVTYDVNRRLYSISNKFLAGNNYYTYIQTNK